MARRGTCDSFSDCLYFYFDVHSVHPPFVSVSLRRPFVRMRVQVDLNIVVPFAKLNSHISNFIIYIAIDLVGKCAFVRKGHCVNIRIRSDIMDLKFSSRPVINKYDARHNSYS